MKEVEGSLDGWIKRSEEKFPHFKTFGLIEHNIKGNIFNILNYPPHISYINNDEKVAINYAKEYLLKIMNQPEAMNRFYSLDKKCSDRWSIILSNLESAGFIGHKKIPEEWHPDTDADGFAYNSMLPDKNIAGKILLRRGHHTGNISVHELTHVATAGNILLPDDMIKLIDNELQGAVNIIHNITSSVEEEGDTLKYFLDYTEVHARINQLRFYLRPPNQAYNLFTIHDLSKVSDDFWLSLFNGKRFNTPYYKIFINGKESIVKLLNTLF